MSNEIPTIEAVCHRRSIYGVLKVMTSLADVYGRDIVPTIVSLARGRELAWLREELSDLIKSGPDMPGEWIESSGTPTGPASDYAMKYVPGERVATLEFAQFIFDSLP